MKTILTIILFCVALTASAQDGHPHHMLSFTQTLRGVDDKPITTSPTDPTPLTLSDVAVGALMGVLPADSNEDGATRFKRGELAHRIYKANNIELTVEEIALIKDRIGKAYGPLVVYAAWPLLDPAAK